MILRFFQWLRDQTKNAILLGLNDAASELDTDHADDGANLLRQRLALPSANGHGEDSDPAGSGPGRGKRQRT